MTTTAEPSRGRWLLIWSMIAIVAAVHVASILPLEPPALAENRVLAEMPPAPKTLKDWGELPKKLDAFAIDQFPLRRYMISGLNFVRYKLGYSGAKNIAVGRNGWLFFDNGAHLNIIAGKARLDDSALGYWIQGLKQRVNYLAHRDAHLYMLLGPVKEDIYPEHRPRWMPHQRVMTEIDQLIEMSRMAGLNQVVDPRASMLAAKGVQQLYDEFDTHWTGAGAYLGYRELMARIAQDDPAMAPLPIEHFQRTILPPEQVQRDMALMLGIADFVQQDRSTFVTWPIHPIEKTTFLGPRRDWKAPQVLHTNAPGGKTLLLLRDSFTIELLPFLKAHYTTIVMAHGQDGWFRTDLLERFRPDTVILVVIETGARYTMNLMPELDAERPR